MIFIFLTTFFAFAEPMNDKAKATHVLAVECTAGNQSACELSRKAMAWDARIWEYMHKHIKLQKRISLQPRLVPENVPDVIDRPWFREMELFPKTLNLSQNAVLTPKLSLIIEEANNIRELLKKAPILLYCEWDHHCKIQKVGLNRCGKPLGFYYYSEIAGLPDAIVDHILHDKNIYLLSEHLQETQNCDERIIPQPVCKNFLCSSPY